MKNAVEVTTWVKSSKNNSDISNYKHDAHEVTLHCYLYEAHTGQGKPINSGRQWGWELGNFLIKIYWKQVFLQNNRPILQLDETSEYLYQLSRW